jgi:ABC-type multidrug transport system fused ATPase/permease subunit
MGGDDARASSHLLLSDDLPGSEDLTDAIVFRLMMQRMLAYGWMLGGTLVLMLGAAACDAAVSVKVGGMVDLLTKLAGAEGAVPPSLVPALKMMIALNLFQALVHFVAYVISARLNEKIMVTLRIELFQALTVREKSFFDANHTGELTNILSSELQLVRDFISIHFINLVKNLLAGTFSLVYMTMLSWKLAVFILLTALPIGMSSAAMSYARNRAEAKARQTLSEASIVAEECLSNINTVHSFCNEHGMIDAYTERLQSYLDTTMGGTLLRGAVRVNATLWGSLVVTAAIWLSSEMITSDQMTPGGLAAFMLQAVNLGFVGDGIVRSYSDIIASLKPCRKVLYLVRLGEARLRAAAEGHKPAISTAEIILDDVSFCYPTRPDRTVLSHLSLVVGAGQTVAIVGPSGGGKSTLMQLVQRFYSPTLPNPTVTAGTVASNGTVGRLTLNGMDLADINVAWLRRHMGVVSQDCVLFCDSIRRNLLIGVQGDGKVPQKKLEAAAKVAFAHDFIAALPEGYDTKVGERGAMLSGGQQQRLAIARAVLLDPPIMLLDEATSALDAKSEDYVKQALASMMQGRTVIIVAHRLSTVQKADKIVVLAGGVLQESGTHDELLARPNSMYSDLVRKQLNQEPNQRKREMSGGGVGRGDGRKY